MTRIGGAVGLWRLGVLLLAAGFWAYEFTVQDLADFGWQFRFLGIWALSLSLVSGALALRLSLVPGAEAPETFFTVTAAVNAACVVMFWWFWTRDPSALMPGGEIAPSQLWYVHGLGPVLQWFEVLVLSRGARRIAAPVGWIAAVAVLYVLWIEGGVRPLNEVPGGLVTTGLPYPMLNDMELAARLSLYAQAAIVGIAFGATFAWAGRRGAGMRASYA